MWLSCAATRRLFLFLITHTHTQIYIYTYIYDIYLISIQKEERRKKRTEKPREGGENRERTYRRFDIIFGRVKFLVSFKIYSLIEFYLIQFLFLY